MTGPIDTPISQPEQDRLGFQYVAQSLLDAIEAQPNDSSLALGLDGPWGSGKSSILGMMLTSVASKNRTEGIGSVIVPFSPWLIKDRDALIALLFSQLQLAMDKAEKKAPISWRKTKSAVGKTLKKAKYLLNRFSGASASLVDVASGLDSTGLSKVISYPFRWLQSLTKDSPVNATLEELRTQLIETLGAIIKLDDTFRIVVLIDDIDRLEPKDTLEVLRLVKAVANFPGIFYIVSYDRATVAHAVGKGAEVESGDAYLEKIIQYSFKVPPLEPFQLRNWLQAELVDIAPSMVDLSTMRVAAVLDVWAGRLLHNPRDVKRLLFAVRAVWSKLEGRIDFLDLVWLQLISLKAASGDRNLYDWLVKYLQSLDALAIGANISGEQDDRIALAGILKALGWKEYRRDGQDLEMDFHWLDTILAGVSASYLGDGGDKWTHVVNENMLQDFRKGRRLSSPWHWRLYFAFNEPTHAITDSEWSALNDAGRKSAKELEDTIKKVLDVRGEERKDAADQIIERAKYDIAGGRLDHPEYWLVAVFHLAGTMQERSKSDKFFGMHKLFGFKLVVFTRDVFNKLEGDIRASTLKELFTSSNHLSTAANLLREQLFASEKPEHEKNRELYLSIDELEYVKSEQLKLYGQLSWKGLIDLSSPFDVLYAWRKAAGNVDGPRQLLTSAFQRKEDLIELFEGLKYVSSSAQNRVPHLSEGMLEVFIDAKDAKRRLEDVARGNDDFSVRAQHLLSLWWVD